MVIDFSKVKRLSEMTPEEIREAERAYEEEYGEEMREDIDRAYREYEEEVMQEKQRRHREECMDD